MPYCTLKNCPREALGDLSHFMITICRSTLLLSLLFVVFSNEFILAANNLIKGGLAFGHDRLGTAAVFRLRSGQMSISLSVVKLVISFLSHLFQYFIITAIFLCASPSSTPDQITDV